MMRRLDVSLVERGFAASRTLAQRLIRAGCVLVDGQPITRPSYLVAPDTPIELIPASHQLYVGRGGEKLAHALSIFALNFGNLRVLDIGASTGGFTDCALRHGARRVYAVDVGHGQLAQSLLADSRVVSLEGLDAREISLVAHLEGTPVDTITCDVSFISLSHIIPALPPLLSSSGFAVLLVKPQFEVGPKGVGRTGIARDPRQHVRVIEGIRELTAEHGFAAKGLVATPLIEADKNIEYLLWIARSGEEERTLSIQKVVDDAFAVWRSI